MASGFFTALDLHVGYLIILFLLKPSDESKGEKLTSCESDTWDLAS